MNITSFCHLPYNSMLNLFRSNLIYHITCIKNNIVILCRKFIEKYKRKYVKSYKYTKAARNNLKNVKHSPFKWIFISILAELKIFLFCLIW